MAATFLHYSAPFFALSGWLACRKPRIALAWQLAAVAILAAYIAGALGFATRQALEPLAVALGYGGLLSHLDYQVGTKPSFLAASALTLLPALILWVAKSGSPTVWIVARFA